MSAHHDILDRFARLMDFEEIIAAIEAAKTVPIDVLCTTDNAAWITPEQAGQVECVLFPEWPPEEKSVVLASAPMHPAVAVKVIGCRIHAFFEEAVIQKTFRTVMVQSNPPARYVTA